MSTVDRGDVDFDRGLFEALRGLRSRLAAERGVLPHAMFHDSALQEMAHYIPQSRGNFFRISGVSEDKLEQFGEEFLSMICGYARRHKLKERTKPAYSIEEIRREYPKAYAKWLPEDDERLKEMYAAGNSVAELAKLFERQMGAIESRLRKLGLKGEVPSRPRTSACDQGVVSASVYDKKNRQRGTLQQEFQDHVLESVDREEFIGQGLEPYADVPGVSKHLRYLEQLDDSDCFRPARAFYRRNHKNPKAFLRFIQDLERLVYAMFILQASTEQRMTRYAAILRVIEQEKGLFVSSSPLQLSTKEQKDVLRALDGPIYSLLSVCKPLLLRLDSLLVEAGARYDHSTITIEHVLPKNPKRNSQWLRDFPDNNERKEWTDKLANLVLLPRTKNSSAQNHDFNRKKETFFQKGKTVTFALTIQLLYEEKWTPEVLERRQKKLIGFLKREWRLGGTTPPRPRNLRLGKGVVAGSKIDQTGQLWEQGLSIEQIAHELGLAKSTIVDHLDRLRAAGLDIDLRAMLPPPERFEEIRMAFEKTGGTLLPPVKELLGYGYSYEEIKVVRLYLLQQQEPGSQKSEP